MDISFKTFMKFVLFFAQQLFVLGVLVPGMISARSSELVVLGGIVTVLELYFCYWFVNRVCKNALNIK